MVVWYTDGRAESEGRNGSNVKPSCGCVDCDEVYSGRGMLQKLLKHVNEKHKLGAKKISTDGSMVIFK